FYQSNLSSPTQPLTGVVAWIPYPGSPLVTTGTISSASGACPGAKCVTNPSTTGAIEASVIVSGAGTYTLRIENQSGSFISSAPLLGGSATSTITAPGTWAVPLASVSTLQIVATSYTSGTPTVTITPLYGPFNLDNPIYTSPAMTAGSGGACTTTDSSSCVHYTMPVTSSGAPTNVMATVQTNSGANTIQFEDCAGNVQTATFAGSGSASPTTATSTTGSDSWTLNTTGITSVCLHTTTYNSGSPTVVFSSVAGSSIGDGHGTAECNNYAQSQIGPLGEYQYGFSSLSDPSLAFMNFVYGGVTTFCDYRTKAVQFGVHVPTDGTHLTVSPGTASKTVGQTQTFADNVDSWIDGSAAGACATGSVYWQSSNTAVATVDNTGLATGVGAGSATITPYCSTVAAASPATITVSASGTYYFPWIASSFGAAIPIAPQAHVDATYNLPTGGTTYTPPDSATLTTDLGLVQPGDVIVLTA